MPTIINFSTTRFEILSCSHKNFFYFNVHYTKEEVLSPLFRLLNLLPTHPSYLLLYPFTDTPQEVFQHIDSVESKLLHKFICLIKFLLKRPVLGFQISVLILLPDQFSDLGHRLLHGSRLPQILEGLCKCILD